MFSSTHHRLKNFFSPRQTPQIDIENPISEPRQDIKTAGKINKERLNAATRQYYLAVGLGIIGLCASGGAEFFLMKYFLSMIENRWERYRQNLFSESATLNQLQFRTEDDLNYKKRRLNDHNSLLKSYYIYEPSLQKILEGHTYPFDKVGDSYWQLEWDRQCMNLISAHKKADTAFLPNISARQTYLDICIAFYESKKKPYQIAYLEKHIGMINEQIEILSSEILKLGNTSLLFFAVNNPAASEWLFIFSGLVAIGLSLNYFLNRLLALPKEERPQLNLNQNTIFKSKIQPESESSTQKRLGFSYTA